jgi:hypothetical protein
MRHDKLLYGTKSDSLLQSSQLTSIPNSYESQSCHVLGPQAFKTSVGYLYASQIPKPRSTPNNLQLLLRQVSQYILRVKKAACVSNRHIYIYIYRDAILHAEDCNALSVTSHPVRNLVRTGQQSNHRGVRLSTIIQPITFPTPHILDNKTWRNIEEWCLLGCSAVWLL